MVIPRTEFNIFITIVDKMEFRQHALIGKGNLFKLILLMLM